MNHPDLTPAQTDVATGILAFCRGHTEHAFATLAGYAGVGKTTVVAHVVRALAADTLAVAVLAPTHKALSVLTAKLDGVPVEAITLQAALAMKVKDQPDGRQECQDTGEPGDLRNFDLAIVDEASMVSDGMFATALLKRGRCRLLFVGDPAQLPPVDMPSSANFADAALSPVFGRQVPKHWALTEVVRQAQGNPIIRLATDARECIAAGTEFSLQRISNLLQAGDDQFIALQPGGVTDISRLVADAMAHGNDTRAMAWDNTTVQAINATVHAILFEGQGHYPAGTPLMAQDGFMGVHPQAHHKKLQVQNSALAIVVQCQQQPHPDEPARDAYRLVLNTGSSHVACWVAVDQRQWQADISACFADYRRLKMREQAASGQERAAIGRQARDASAMGWVLKARYAPLRYAYAMTVHKAQGSTFDAVVLAWASFARCRDVQLRNRLAYVALTRTRKFAVVCA